VHCFVVDLVSCVLFPGGLSFNDLFCWTPYEQTLEMQHTNLRNTQENNRNLNILLGFHFQYPRLFSVGTFSHKGPTRKQASKSVISVLLIFLRKNSWIDDNFAYAIIIFLYFFRFILCCFKIKLAFEIHFFVCFCYY